MGEIVVKNAVVRKPNCMYYIDKDGNLCEAPMVHGKKGAHKDKKEKKSKKKSK